MRTIEVTTAVFAKIWALRLEGEETENAVLDRVLTPPATSTPQPLAPSRPRAVAKNYQDRGPRTWNKPTWATDIAEVLEELGGTARLTDIYAGVKRLRQDTGRTRPPSLQATIRRTLENHSSQSDNYTGGADLFCMPEGKGAGIWKLR